MTKRQLAARRYRDAVAGGRLRMDALGHLPHSDPERIRTEVNDRNSPYGRVLLDHWIDYPERLLEVLDNPREMPDWESWELLGMEFRECELCGKRLFWRTDGRELKLFTIVKSYSQPIPCKYASGVPASVEFEIDVPSGTLVMGNDLRGIFAEVPAEWISVNNLDGRIRYMTHYAAAGLLTGSTNDGGAGVFVSPKSILIAQADEGQRELVEDGIIHHRRADISFQLWWYGAADYDRCLSLNPTLTKRVLPPDPKKYYIHDELFRLEVPAGRWKMIHSTQHSGRSWEDGGRTLSRLVKV